MKFKSSRLIMIEVVLFAALAIPLPVAAQRTRYKLIDIGTLGGPASYLTESGAGGGEPVLNNAGVLVGKANTPDTDPLPMPIQVTYHFNRAMDDRNFSPHESKRELRSDRHWSAPGTGRSTGRWQAARLTLGPTLRRTSALVREWSQN